ncbi:MAG: thiamine pyrophosphate-dependent enzyme [Clostridia bacterium]|jgi:2-oxoglutarate ferredoxin oxidoreductase subunit beta
MSTVIKKPHALMDISMHYCPGCTHGIIHRLIAEVLDELDVEGTTVGISSVGCTYNNYEYFNCDMVQSAHGRAPAVATGVKRVNPDNVVFTYQGDGDLAAIGTAEIIHAAARGEKTTTIFVNNAIYGMTGGQMAPTTLVGQITTTSPYGRNPEVNGHPIDVCNLISTLEGAVFVERVSMHDIKNINNAKKAIKKAFMIQIAKKGFSIVEVLSSCPTNWGLEPQDSMNWIKDNMVPKYPVGNFKGKDLEV